jgi:hypothetical protein
MGPCFARYCEEVWRRGEAPAPGATASHLRRGARCFAPHVSRCARYFIVCLDVGRGLVNGASRGTVFFFFSVGHATDQSTLDLKIYSFINVSYLHVTA